jgi:uncharacterized membrane protein YdjX (TVP38/TMEM64 family)
MVWHCSAAWRCHGVAARSVWRQRTRVSSSDARVCVPLLMPRCSCAVHLHPAAALLAACAGALYGFLLAIPIVWTCAVVSACVGVGGDTVATCPLTPVCVAL